MNDNVIPIPLQCDVDIEPGVQCPSRNAIWDDGYQGNLCIVHKAAREQAKRRHPSNLDAKKD